MKAERRHELKENDLVHFIETSREYVQQHGQRIGLYVVAVVAVVVIGTLVFNARGKTARDSWVGMLELSFTDPATTKTELAKLTALINDSSDREFILAGLIRKGQVALEQSEKAGPTPDRPLLDDAKSAFTELLAKFPDNPVAFGTAHLGLATVAENEFVLDATHSPSHRAEAQQHLQAVKDHAACSTLPVYRLALDRLAALDTTFQVVTFAPPLPPPTLTPIDPPTGDVVPLTPVTPPGGEVPTTVVPPVAPPSGGP